MHLGTEARRWSAHTHGDPHHDQQQRPRGDLAHRDEERPLRGRPDHQAHRWYSHRGADQRRVPGHPGAPPHARDRLNHPIRASWKECPN